MPARFVTAVVAPALLGAALASVAPAGLRAQQPGNPPPPADTLPADSVPRDPATARSDSLAERLRQAERAIELLRGQVAAQGATAPQTASRARLEIAGRVLVNAFANDGRVNNADNPQFARPDTAGALSNRSAGGAMRQSSLSGLVTVDRVLGATFQGDVVADFYGGQQPSLGGRNFPLLRLRVARALLFWPHAEVMAGQDSPLVAPVDPVSVAAVGSPGFVQSGNLYSWTPQLRATVERPGRVRLAVQGAIVAPTTGDPQGAFDTSGDAAERSARPALQARVRARWGQDARDGNEGAGEVGLGVHRGWLATPGDTLATSGGVVASLTLPLGRVFEVRGEGYRGQGFRVLGGAAVGQLAGVGGRPVRDDGGWVQLNARHRTYVTAGAGVGTSRPRRADLLPGGARLRNTVAEGHVIVRPDGPIVLGVEYRRIATTYAAGPVVSGHVNVAVGYEF